MDTNDRIAQWEKMTREAPDDMAWFSLGNAYKEAGRLAEAADALGKALECNGQMSRAYQLRGQVLIQLGRHDEAADLLTRGYAIAAQRGDVMPQRAMGALLEKIGRPVPAANAPGHSGAAGPAGPGPAVPASDPHVILDRRTGRPGARMAEPPMRGPLGRFIQAHYSQETWREWLGMGTKVINELRLDFSNPHHGQLYDQHMMEWLGISEDEVAAFAKEPPAPARPG